MERKMYELTEKQSQYCIEVQMPSDEEFKARSKKNHKPWGLLKRDHALSALRGTRDYAMGLGQGRVDAARGLDYSEERFSSNYNLGYHDGYLNYKSDRHGWDKATQERFDAKYVREEN